MILVRDPAHAAVASDRPHAERERREDDHRDDDRSDNARLPPRQGPATLGEGNSDLGGAGKDQRHDGPHGQLVPLRHAQPVVGGRREERVQSAHLQQGGRGRRGREEQRHKSGEATRGEREVHQQRDGQCDVPAAREREEERQEQEGRGARGQTADPGRPAALRGDHEKYRERHHDERREDVPVPERGSQAREQLGVGDDVRSDLAEEGVGGDHEHDEGEAVTRQAELPRAAGQHSPRGHHEQVESSDVERHPGEIRSGRPEHGEPDPCHEGGERRQRNEVGPRRPHEAAASPDSPQGEPRQHEDHGRSALQKVAAGEEAHGCDRGQQHRDRPHRRAATALGRHRPRTARTAVVCPSRRGRWMQVRSLPCRSRRLPVPQRMSILDRAGAPVRAAPQSHRRGLV